MKPYTDQELQDYLLYHGYNVPMIVIRTWGNLRQSKGTKEHNRRTKVERWLHYMARDKYAKVTTFPEFLLMFIVNKEEYEFRRANQTSRTMSQLAVSRQTETLAGVRGR